MFLFLLVENLEEYKLASLEYRLDFGLYGAVVTRRTCTTVERT